MTMSERQIAAGEFKARCLAILDDVERNGEAVLVTKRGRPVARLVPLTRRKGASLRGSVRHEADLLAPIGGKWNAER